MMRTRLILPLLAGLGLGGCVAYPAPVAYAPQPGPVYAYPPPAAVYGAPPPARYWVPRRCDGWGRCWGGYWR
ncbi:hypothetical protein [Neoroseomonas soli]|uniref:hypothetical protein n=1 Tax=Neoroseomonas soli TaxID=1081025 RepID=UPI001BAA329B|nr:hypothetical protein [Neoroseomonas soli]